MADYVEGLTDAELRTKLAEFGFPLVPITATTRKVMTKKLKLLIENKNKVNSEGRRSLAKYSSEEESDSEIKSKRDKNRRATVATVMQPPLSTSRVRKSTRTLSKEEPEDIAPSTTSVTSEVKTTTRRTTRIIKPVLEDDFETGSDSEQEIDDYVNNSGTSESANTSAKSSYTSYGITSSLSPRVSVTQSVLSDSKSPTTDYSKTDYSKPSTDYSSPKPVSSTSSYSSRYSTYTSNSNDVDASLDKLSQIRSRMSLGTNYERPTFGTTTERKVIGSTSYGDNDTPIETPFLSNFTRRLSQLSSSPLPKTDYSYKNDIIKEHDANGSSYNRLYLSRNKKRDYPQDFKLSQEKNIIKNNIVSLTLLGIVCVFFIAIFLLYMGIRTEQLPAIVDTTKYILPTCAEGDYQSKPGINCLLQSEITDTLNLLKIMLPELMNKALYYHCNNVESIPYMTDDHIIDHLAKHYAPRDPYLVKKDINNLQFVIMKNPELGISIIKRDGFPKAVQTVDSMDQILGSRVNNNLAMIILNPEISWKCFIVNKLYAIASSMFIVGMGFLIIFLMQRGYKHYQRYYKVKNEKIYSMVEKIIDILQSNVSENSDNFLAVNHVRDMIIPPQDRKHMASIWDSAVKFLNENESRVRTEVQIVAGEEFHVWRWLGSPNLNMSGSPRSKIWQGQAFETQVGSVNSLPCSPTPCLKVRGFDERERNRLTIRDAVLSKCASQCKILHCDVDSNSNCVYLKCANQNEAAIAYRNLHGWWYDGHLLTVKYLRLERYMQRFPDSPTKGPPYLQAPSNISVTNDWSNKDD